MFYLYDFIGKYDVALINTNFYGFDLLGIGWLNGFILAIAVWILQYIQVKLSLSYNQSDIKKSGVVLEKKKDATDYQSFMPDPDILNKFMLYGLPVMIAIFTYTFFAWVGIYWWVGTLFMIVQQYIVNKIIKK
jgi:membrane protein insertase Oxa1/YidC/SpoIIIJ